MRSLSTALPHQQVIVALEVPNGYQPWLQDSCDVTPCSRVPDDIITGHNVLKVISMNLEFMRDSEF